MEILKLTETGVEAAARSAAAVLKAGGVILYPTDTLYGLGADAFSDDAVERVYALKGRDERKPLHALVSDLDMAARYGEIGDSVRQLAHALPKGKVSFIVSALPGVDGIAADGTFGFRIPDHEFCQALLSAFGAPITATSANPTGIEPAQTVPDILAQFGPGIMQIDMILDGGAAPATQPSTVIDMTAAHPVILREAAVPASDIWEVLEQFDVVHG
jgi:L-threonylcarbamoyladenylate synthase